MTETHGLPGLADVQEALMPVTRCLRRAPPVQSATLSGGNVDLDRLGSLFVLAAA